MLSAAARLRRSQDFDLVVRRGTRCGRPRLVVHALLGPAPSGSDVRWVHVGTVRALRQAQPIGDLVDGTSPVNGVARLTGPRVGFVVSKAVGGSVVRHRVARRLRHLMRERLGFLPPTVDVVIRALPRAGMSTSIELAGDLDSALRKLRLVPSDAACGAPR